MPGYKTSMYPFQTRISYMDSYRVSCRFAKQAIDSFDVNLSNSFMDLFYSRKFKIHLTTLRGSLSLYDSD